MASLHLCTLLTYPYVVRYAHVPSLDALIRTHDTDNVCWQGIKLMDINEIVIFENMNSCFVKDGETLCAMCRDIYFRQEPTFFNTHRSLFLFFISVTTVLITVQQFNLFYYKKKSKEEIYSTIISNRPVTPSFWEKRRTTVYEPLPPPPPVDWLFKEQQE